MCFMSQIPNYLTYIILILNCLKDIKKSFNLYKPYLVMTSLKASQGLCQFDVHVLAQLARIELSLATSINSTTLLRVVGCAGATLTLPRTLYGFNRTLTGPYFDITSAATWVRLPGSRSRSRPFPKISHFQGLFFSQRPERSVFVFE